MSADPEFEQLVKLHYRDLYRFGLSLTGSESDACDLTQETFYIWAKKRNQITNPRRVKGWLFTTLHRQFLQTCRRRKRFKDEPIDQLPPDILYVSSDCADRTDARLLIKSLAEIDEDYRAPLILYYMEDLSYNQIAELLEIPLGTVQSRIARAKIKLLELLNETVAPAAK